MNVEQLEDWEASWIWGDGPESPRNEWRCFRKSFRLEGSIVQEALLRITADSRYTVYVNGVRVGSGPVRSWPFELAYDTYEIGHLLMPDRMNVIAVLVMHYGVSTFNYLRGRGGLLAQVELHGGESGVKVVALTDESWHTSRHLGHDPRSPRMSCQLGFAERIDAAMWPEDWKTRDDDGESWEASRVIGKPGMRPWTKLVRRDIPPLTEETVYPKRVIELNEVRPAVRTTHIDVRAHMMPGSANHANHVALAGYIGTVLRLARGGEITFCLLNARKDFGDVCVGGQWYTSAQMRGDEQMRMLTVRLEEGDHFFLINVTGSDHRSGLHLGIDSESLFELRSPYTALHGTAAWNHQATDGEVSPFIAIGPFAWAELIDHQEANDPLPSFAAAERKWADGLDRAEEMEEAATVRQHLEITREQKAYLRTKHLAAAHYEVLLQELQDWISFIPNSLVSRDHVFASCVWKRGSLSHKVPYSLQNAVLPHAIPADIPLFAGADTELVIDFGCLYSGYVEFEVAAGVGTVLDFYGIEYMHEGWRQETYRLDNTLRYTCREGRQQYRSEVRRGLRYLIVTVRGIVKPVKLYEVKLLQSSYPTAELGSFQCSDPLLNDIWNISKHTTKLCMEDTFVDCPAYEQTFWVGDSRNEALINYYVFGATAIVKRSLKLVPGSGGMTPLYVNQVPSGWNSVIPNWTFFWAMACAEYYEHTGDEQFAREMWPHIRYTLNHYLQKLDEQGLLCMKGWNFLDWAPIDQPRDGVISHQNMFLVTTLRICAKLADIADDVEAARTYRESAEQLAEAINKHLWSNERRAYIDCIHSDGRRSEVFSMQTQVVASLCGIAAADQERLDRIQSYVVAPPKDFVQLGSPFMSFFYYEALSQLNPTTMNAADILLDDMRRQYGLMIDSGATTCYESYPKLSNNQIDRRRLTRSHCHAWSAAPGYFLGTELLGVRRTAPGWSTLCIAPKPAAGVHWARGTVPLPQGGWVEVDWSVDQQEKTIYLRYNVPNGHEVTVMPPEGYRVVVRNH